MSREVQVAQGLLDRLDQAELLAQPDQQDRLVLLVLRDLREPLARLDLQDLQVLQDRVDLPEARERPGLQARLVALEQLERLALPDPLASPDRQE